MQNNKLSSLMMQKLVKFNKLLRIVYLEITHQLGNNLTQKYTLTQTSWREFSMKNLNLTSINLKKKNKMSFEKSSAIQSNMKSFINDKQSNQNHQFKPTKVLFLRNLPKDVTEQELMRVLSYQYGFVEKVLIMIQKAHAFIQFDSLETATKQQQESEVNQPLQDSKVLLVSITNIKYPVNADVLFTIFQKYGDPQRIVIFPRQQGEQALVEFQTFEQAKKVKLLLDGQGMYGVSQPANVMKIQFSELQKLEINTQTLKARDFTKQTVGSFVQNQIDKQGDLSINKDDNGISRTEFSDMFEKAYQKVQTNMKHEFNLVSHQSDQEMNPVNSESIFTFGLDQFSIDFNKIQTQAAQQQNDSLQQIHTSKVLILSNLPVNVHPHLLFKLFGIYGNVLRVKILFNKRETALIEFEDINQAKTAKQFLNGIQFFSTNIQVNFSKNSLAVITPSQLSIGTDLLAAKIFRIWQVQAKYFTYRISLRV
eukprot:403358967